MKRNHHRGYVLLFVLLVLLVMSLGAAAYFESTARAQMGSLAASGQQIAYSRAKFAADQAIADIRAGAIVLSPSMPQQQRPSAPTGLADCVVGNNDCVIRGSNAVPCLLGNGACTGITPLDNGPTDDLRDGGGLQWDYIIYRLQNQPLQLRFNILATGYYGYAGSKNLATSQIEVEIDVGTGASGPADSYAGASGKL